MMSLPGLRFHHFGLAVRDPVRALEFLGRAGYDCGRTVFDPLQKVDLNWCVRPGEPAVEVVSQLDDGPLSSVLANQGSSFYHLCYEIDMPAESVVNGFAQTGIRIATVRPPLPAVLFGGRLVSFHVVRGFGLIELLEGASGGQTPTGEGG